MAEYMQALREASDWSSLNNSENPSLWRVALENDLNAEFLELGGRICIMRSVVIDLPESKAEVENICSEAAKNQVAVLKERPSILALEENRLICYRRVPLNLDAESFVNQVQDWLNDVAWWKACLNKESSSQMNNFFSQSAFFNFKP